ncbi:aromatic ring-opening dioxygenase subunit LigA [Pseudomaricurvus alcaniphilus]|uniref:aromatic ring-opening dioxygenase subunit LigA n=1 Tax=Pseudomaricurvus alcaniphilus TaxID=1166482 RepID=UPI00140DF820|nr:aromatic ring-opening dioxygenase subunit LigA [Pseudomaricurvus alcaniphilus]NHN39876.1 aromatic ring-opening dioxygenase subunit LigA [Pseudomaricurvus alcaniphilus]
MSLYQTQKLLYNLNKSTELQAQFFADKQSVLKNYRLDEEEAEAIVKPDIGLLYIMGVNGQILMHYAAMCGYAWPEYIKAMRDALEIYGNVRAGLYVTTDGKGAV